MDAPAHDTRSFDVVIMGGGLAGLTLALQLVRERAGTSVLVVERSEHPVEEAAHKVGEATVENSAHYFRDVLGLEDYLDEDQLRKMGLRFFISTDDKPRLSQRLEAGPRDFLASKTYQLDRGRFENALGRFVTEAGVTFMHGWRVRGFELDPDGHRAVLARGDDEREVTGRWLVDATGRQALVKRKLDLIEDVDHDCNAAWFRLSDFISMDDLVHEEDPPPDDETLATWRERVPNGQRWRSTNHLMGRGYWAWLIPLSSGSISVGLVADPRHVPFEDMKDFDTLLGWMERNEPELHRAVVRRRDSLQDFRRLKHFAHSVKRVCSPERWALTGEAGAFLDPLYSPGSDFIALANTYIVDLVTRDLAGEPVDEWAERYNDAYLEAFHSALVTWEDQYPLMGNPQVYAAKAAWDTLAYFAVPNVLFLNGRMNDWEFMEGVRHQMDRFNALNRTMQQLFRDWDEVAPGHDTSDYVDLSDEAFARLNEELLTRLDADAVRRRIERNLGFLADVASTMAEGAIRAAGLSADGPGAEGLVGAAEELDKLAGSGSSPNGGRDGGGAREGLPSAKAAIESIWQSERASAQS